jgi:hypothetical protein
MTRIDASGIPAFAPARLLTNAPTSYRAASNGKTVLVAYETMNAGKPELGFKLVDSSGSSIQSGTLPDPEERSYAVGCDGTNYLAVWEAKTPPYVRAVYIDTKSGVVVTNALSERKAAIQGIGHGKKGYLVATARSRSSGDDYPPMLHVSEEGVLRSEGGRLIYPGTVFSKDGPPVAVISEEEDWVLFTVDSYHTLYSFTITSNNNDLTIQRGTYQQLHISSGTFALESCITRFRPEEILVTVSSGYAILNRTAGADYFGPRIYTTQRGPPSARALLGTWLHGRSTIIHRIRCAFCVWPKTDLESMAIRFPSRTQPASVTPHVCSTAATTCWGGEGMRPIPT